MHSCNIKTRHENEEKNYDIVINLLVCSILYFGIIIVVVKINLYRVKSLTHIYDKRLVKLLVIGNANFVYFLHIAYSMIGVIHNTLEKLVLCILSSDFWYFI
jgi:hypothetical protein